MNRRELMAARGLYKRLVRDGRLYAAAKLRCTIKERLAR